MTDIGETAGTSPVLVRNEDFSRSIMALFDSRAHAEAAQQDLIAAGIHDQDIALIADGDPRAGTQADIDDPTAGGFWQTFKDLFMPEEDAGQFAEGVRRGGVTLSVRTDTTNHDRVAELLDRDGAVDLDERQELWRNDGWTGYTGRDPLVEAKTPALSVQADNEDMSYAPASAATAGFGVSAIDLHVPDDEAAPLVESPGALPPSALDAALAAVDPKSDAPTIDLRDPRRISPRLRSYSSISGE